MHLTSANLSALLPCAQRAVQLHNRAEAPHRPEVSHLPGPGTPVCLRRPCAPDCIRRGNNNH